MKKHNSTVLLAIAFLLFYQPVWAEEAPKKEATASVEASDSRNLGDNTIGGWGTFESGVDSWTEGQKQAIANARTQGQIAGTIDDQALKAQADSSVKVTNTGSTDQDRGPAKITTRATGERGSWVAKNIEEHGYAWSGNHSLFKQPPVSIEGCRPLGITTITTAYGKNMIEYTIKDSGNKELNIFNQAGTSYDGPRRFAPTERSADLSFGGGVWGYGTKAQGEGVGATITSPQITGEGIYKVYQIPGDHGGSITGADATTIVKE